MGETILNNERYKIVQATDYYPFGLEFQKTTGENDYGFNSIELNEDLQVNTAMYRTYDPTLGRWWQVDPLAEQYYSYSPYNYVLGNPIIFIDPDGRSVDGIIVDEDGNTVGNDGKDDNKVYVINTQESDFGGVPGAGLSKKRVKQIKKFIKSNSGNAEAFSGSDIYNDLTEIEGSTTTRQDMMDAVSGDDGQGGTSDSNNREYGASVMADGSVVVGEPGPVTTPSKGATFSDYSSGEKTRIHSHPSGTETKSSTSLQLDPFGGQSKEVTTTTTIPYRQSPSQRDVSNAGKQVRYVAGKGSGKIYIYNNQGVRATLPSERFVNPK